MTKVTGTVKWFSNKKGFGFISPTSDNSPTQDEIFVHQTNIFSDGAYRTLMEGAEVEFEVEKEHDSGKFKAVNVTAPGGGSLKPPPRDKRRRPRGFGDNDDEGDEGDDKGSRGNAELGGEEKKQPPRSSTNSHNRNGRRVAPQEKSSNNDDGDGRPKREPLFHAIIQEDIKQEIADKGIILGKRSTIDVAIGGTRIKLGQGGYAGLADATALIGEGTYTCDDMGLVTFNWERSIVFQDGVWKAADAGKLMGTLSLTADGIGPVEPAETAEKLWGADKSDPKDAFEVNGFKMKKVVLSRPPGVRGRRGPGGFGGSGGKKD